MRLFLTAFQFLTIIPLPMNGSWGEGDMGRSMRFFPLVGLLLGAMLALARYGFSYLFPSPVVDLMLVVLLALVTGGLHIDGMADVCDGLGARGSRERFLEVMKDSSVGAMGVIGVVLGLMLKYQSLQQLPLPAKTGAIILFPAVARFAQVQMAVGSRRARGDGLGALFIAGAGKFELFCAGVTILVAGYCILGIAGIICCIIGSLFAILARTYFHHRLGGVTGDIIGCVSELVEILCLLTVLAVWNRPWTGI